VQIAEQGRYRIDIYSMLGKLVKTMFDQEIEKGEYYFDWHGEDGSGAPLPAGVYIVNSAWKQYSASLQGSFS
jgi:flagellar hook assembly protein FlgD